MIRTVAFIFILFVCLFANAQVTFQKTYPNASISGFDNPRSFRETPDGGFIVANRDLMKTDVNGNLLWRKSYGDLDAKSVQLTDDGGFIVVGTTFSFGAGSSDVYVVRTNSNGDTLWTKTYGGTDYDGGYSAQQTTDGGFIISAFTRSFSVSPNTSDDIYLIKTDSMGNESWAKSYDGGFGDEDEGYVVQQTADGGYVIGGITGLQVNMADVSILKTDNAGNVQWARAFGGTYHDYGFSVQQTTDGGYILSGMAASFFGGSQGDMYIVKLDGSGNLSWSRTIADLDTMNSESAHSVRQTNDGGYIIIGHRRISSNISYVYLVKINSFGNLQWAMIYDGPGTSSVGFAVRQTTDGGYIILGKDDNNIYLIKTNSSGNSGCNESLASSDLTIPPTQVTIQSPTIQIVNSVVTSPSATITSGGTVTTLCYSGPTGINKTEEQENMLSLFPNPVTSELRIQTSNFKVESVEVYDMLGRFYNSEFSILNSELALDISFLSPGLYFLKLKGAGTERVARFVKQ